MLYFVARYRFDEATGRYAVKDRIGFASYRVAMAEAAIEREHSERLGLHLMVRVEIRSGDGYTDAPDPVRDAAYADRAALGRLTGSGGL